MMVAPGLTIVPPPAKTETVSEYRITGDTLRFHIFFRNCICRKRNFRHHRPHAGPVLMLSKFFHFGAVDRFNEGFPGAEVAIQRAGSDG